LAEDITRELLPATYSATGRYFRTWGRSITEDEAISIRALAFSAAPEWLQKSWDSAKRLGLDWLSAEEIDAEIEAARKARRDRQSLTQ
jgi:hypothetical protein